jgi:DNA-binding Lrp family transcriptional regulator
MKAVTKNGILKVFAGIAIALCALTIIKIKRNNPQSTERITQFPRFEAMDVNGKRFDSRECFGNITFVQFIKARNSADLEFVKEFYERWKDENIHIILITDDLMALNKKLKMDLKKAMIFEKYEELSIPFKAPTGGTHFLFGASGVLLNAIRSDVAYGSVHALFNRQIKNKYFRIPELVRINENIKNHEWFQQVAEVIENDRKEAYIVALLTSICEGCTSGKILDYLKEFYGKNKDRVGLVCILGGRFVREDIPVLKSQLRVDFTILVPAPSLSNKWNGLIQDYSEAELTGIVFAVERMGTIVRIAESGCQDCWEGFVSYLNSKIISK